MNALKASRFNLAVPAGGEQLLFNSATTALLRVDGETFDALKSLFPDGATGTAAYRATASSQRPQTSTATFAKPS